MLRYLLVCGQMLLAYGTGFVFAADPAIDLRGKVVAAKDGQPIAGARALLLKAGASDTTDAKGEFQILADQIATIRKVNGSGFRSQADAWTETYDTKGRASLAGETRTPAYARKEGLSAQPVILAKAAATLDTLLITRAGYAPYKAAVAVYRGSIDSIRLQTSGIGFEIRKPEAITIPCGTTTTQDYQMDFVCESDNAELGAAIYVQSRPSGCGPFSAATYTAERGWIQTADGVSPLEQVSYDAGGNHKNDRLTFLWRGKYFSFYHSSFGFGWRACAHPDCMQICQDLECRGIVLDGCARSACKTPPSLSVRCAVVKPDGTVPERVDSWTTKVPGMEINQMPCNGDPQCK